MHDGPPVGRYPLCSNLLGRHGTSWDGHSDIKGNHSGFAAETDQPVAGLLTDLDQRGLLDETLVVWAGEFGRLPVAQKGAKPGRDHNPHCFTAWPAGGGVKGGVSYGESDEVGHKAAVDKVQMISMPRFCICLGSITNN